MGQPFLSLEFCPGGSLERKLSGRPLPAREAAQLVETLGRTMHAAHAAGVIHRDLKPANVLLDADGTPKVADFGLAKRLDEAGQTASGAILGTPSYMAPEQASGQSKVSGPAADTYALGAILYECLTGRPPFKGVTPMETLLQVLGEEPVPPRRLQPGCPRDLEVICLKCLHKQPHRRYATALQLAEDLARWSAGEPIRARPIGRAERVLRWARRRPAWAALAGVVAAAVIAALLGLQAHVRQLHELNTSLESALGQAENERNAARTARNNEADARRATETTLTDTFTSFGLVADERNQPLQAMLWFANAARQARNDPERQRLNLVRVRAWQQRRLTCVPVAALPHTSTLFRSCAFHPSGRYFLTVSTNNQAILWDVARERALPLPGGPRPIPCAVWSPDGTVLALGTAGEGVELFHFPSGALLRRVPQDHPVTALAFSRDGRLLALAGKAARVWDCRRQEFVTAVLPHPLPVWTLTFNNTGDWLATGCADYQARVFRVPGKAADAEPLFDPVPHQGFWGVHDYRTPPPAPPLFVDGNRLLVTLTKRSLILTDAVSGKPVNKAEIKGPHTGYHSCMVASPDGRYVYIGGAHGASLYDVVLCRPAGSLHKEDGGFITAAFSPDGRLLLIKSGRDIQLLTVPGLTPAGPALPLQSTALQVCFAPDGRLAAAADFAGLVRVWAPQEARPRDHSLGLDGTGSLVRLSRDGRFVFPTGMTFHHTTLHTTRVYDARTGSPAGPPVSPEGVILDADLSPDGSRLVVVSSPGRLAMPLGSGASADGEVTFWERKTGKLLKGPVWLPAEPRSVRYSPDGRRVAVLGARGQVRVLDSAKQALADRLHSEAYPPKIPEEFEKFVFTRGNSLLLTPPRSTRVVQPEDDLNASSKSWYCHSPPRRRRALGSCLSSCRASSRSSLLKGERNET